MAAMGRDLATACVEELGYRMNWVEPDGWCLLECVAPYLDERAAVLRLALKTIRDGLPLAHLVASTRGEAKNEYGRLLNRISVAERNIGDHYNTGLWDFMPQAMSCVSARPLLIYSGDVR
jgi:hypothetical protein